MLPARDHISFLTPEIYFSTSVLILWLGSLAIVLTPKHSFTSISLLVRVSESFWYGCLHILLMVEF